VQAPVFNVIVASRTIGDEETSVWLQNTGTSRLEIESGQCAKTKLAQRTIN
jgi:hypothetical protein